MRLPSVVFETTASAIPPLRRCAQIIKLMAGSVNAGSELNVAVYSIFMEQ